MARGIGYVESDIAAEQRRISQAEGDADSCIICQEAFSEFLPADEYTDVGVCSKRCADAVIAECGGLPNEFSLDEALRNPSAIALARIAVQSNLKSQEQRTYKAQDLKKRATEFIEQRKGRRHLIGNEIEETKDKLFRLLLQLWSEEYTDDELKIIEALITEREHKGL